MADEENWKAVLEIDLQSREGKTIPGRVYHRGPLLIQKPFYPEGPEICHLYILHPPGGVVAGDELGLTLCAESGARGLLTTPSAAKFYRSPVPQLWGRSRQTFRVASGASLEWFPQETILFNGARARIETRVDLEETASFLGWEILSLGRPASGERFNEGICFQRFEIYRQGEPVWIEQNRIEGGSRFLDARWGMGGYSVTGTFAAVLPRHGSFPEIPPQMKEASGEDLFSVTRMGEVLLGRYLGCHAEHAKFFFIRIWEIIRSHAMNRKISIPRIWNT